MKASINLAISLDGCIARPDGDVSWLDPYHGDDGGFAEFFASVDCLVMGRKSFEKVLSFDVDWPYGDKPVIVLSRSELAIPAGLQGTTEQMAGDPAELVAALQQRGFEHLYVDGGATIREFLAAGLIDRMTLTRVPIILGSGISLFDGLEIELGLEHVATRSFDNGLVQSEYRVGGGIGLRAVSESDLDVLFEFERDPEAVHMAAFTHEDPSDREAFLAHWRRILKAPSVIARTITRGGAVLGSVLSYEEEGSPEVTYWIGRPHWGQGVATEALGQFLKSVDPRRPMRARAAKDNVASIRVLEKCGFVVVAEARGFANARGAEIDEVELELASEN